MEFNLEATRKYYDEIASTYDLDRGPGDKYYPCHLFRFEIVKKILAQIPKGRILDAGCGTGPLLAHLVKSGIDCAGFDISAGMLQFAKEKLKSLGADKIPLIQTDAANLSIFPDKSFDHVLALGMFPYIPDELETKCYSELKRVMKPGGYLVTAHQNELFDLFTFNKYTLRFFEKNFFPLLGKMAGLNNSVESLRAKISELIVNPDKPQNKDPVKGGRDIILTKPENPFEYPSKLKAYGFQSRSFEYYHFHAMPPLIRDTDDIFSRASEKLELELSSTWQAQFMASMFVNVAQLDS